jgi:V8-like Glu-specific endopeptidase
MLVTTGHSVNKNDYKNFSFVFDFMLDKNGKPKTIFKASSVYKGVDILQRYDSILGIDYSIIKLNKPVDTLRKPKINKQGFTLPASFYVVGTPGGIPLKLAKNAYLILNTQKQYFTVGSDTYEGNSGSPVFNSRTHEIEGYLVKGNKDFEFKMLDCRNTQVCPHPTCPGSEGERVIRISEIMNLIN